MTVCECTRDLRSDREPSPSEAIVDSLHCEKCGDGRDGPWDTMPKTVIKGRKRHLTVDTLGLVLRVLVTAANVPEREGAKLVLSQVQQMGDAVSRLHTIWVDGGYSGDPFLRWVMDTYRWIVQVVLRPKQRHSFVLLPKRACCGTDFWLVELVSPLDQRL